MKQLFLILTCLLFSLGSYAQSVENIRVEPEGENILVHYRIGGSTDAQTFNVRLYCSVDGGNRFQPSTVIGDVGENIRGGKSNYTITWDVFEDRDEIGEVEFFVSVELIRDLGQGEIQESTQVEYEYSGVDVFLNITGSTLCPYGFSTGIVYNKWGGYITYRFGFDDPGQYYYTDWRIYVAGLVRELFKIGKYSMILYAGAGAINEYYEDYTGGGYSDFTTFIADAGIMNKIGRVNLVVGVEYINVVGWTQPVVGIGYSHPIKRKAK